METKEIKEIQIINYLDSLGIQPTKVKGCNYYYRAFYRGGKDPASMKVDRSFNVWYDYVTGQGGSIIDLCMCVEQCNTHTAMLKLTDFAGGDKAICNIQIEEHHTTSAVDSKCTILLERDIYYFPIQNYIRERGISVTVAKRYCKEVHYSFDNGTTKSWGLGFKTDSGVWVIRNKKFKGYAGAGVGITTIPVNGATSYAVFEGFFDFLSYVQLYGEPKINVIVLNSVHNIKHTEKLFREAVRVYLMLDNDSAGDKTVNTLSAQYGAKIIDKRQHYAPCKDFNEYLITKNKQAL